MKACHGAEDRYWLHPSLNTNSADFRQNKIHPIFARACHSAGFNIHAEYCNRKNNTFPNILFSCVKGKDRNEVKEAEYTSKRPRNVKNPHQAAIPRSTRTLAPRHSKCPFRFRVYWDNEVSRWFLPHKQSGNACHAGHCQLSSEHLSIRTKFAPKNELALSVDLLDCHVGTTAAARVIQHRTNLPLDVEQLRYLQRRNKDNVLINSSRTTAADRLLHDLERDHRTSFVALYGELHSGLVTIKTRRQHMNLASEINEVSDEMGDDTDSPKELTKHQLQNLVVGDTGQILLSIAWTNDIGKRNFDMFPEFLGGDDKEKTNSEDRPLYTFCGKDSTNKTFGHTWAFLPSKSTWVYSWLFNNALPILHPGSALKRVQIFITDACQQESVAADSCCGNGAFLEKVLPNARHRHCAWHKINRNLTEDAKYKSKFLSEKDKDVGACVEIDVIVRWLWHFIKYYETKEESNVAMALMTQYLTEDQSHHFGEISN